MSEAQASTEPTSGSGGSNGEAAENPPAGWTVSPVTAAIAVLADVAAVLVFAAIGRATHDEGGALLGTLSTAWPFLIGLSIGWIIVGWLIVLAIYREAALPDPQRAWPVGIIVWVCTVLCGMLLRIGVGEGTALPFVLVATGFNLLTLVGWRLLAGLAVSSARRR